jgi:DNA-binding NarL/FixJ family response regulator
MSGMSARTLEEELQTMSFLIADPSSARKSIRSLLTQYGVKPHQIQVAEHFSTIEEILKAQPTHVVFADYGFLGASAFDILELHQHIAPIGSPRAFFLLTSKESAALTGNAADSEVDAVLTKPFTFESLRQGFSEVLQRKLQPTPVQRQLDEIKTLIGTANFPAALEKLEAARADASSAPLFHYYEGISRHALLDPAAAKASLERGLALQPTHYRCLMALLDVLIAEKDHAQAYAIGKRIAAHHTIPLKRIPDLIRLSILNSYPSDILDFCEIGDSLLAADDALASHLAAGLVVCGLHFLKQSDTPSALQAFRKAELASRGRPRILERILLALFEAGLDDAAKPFLDRAPEEVRHSAELDQARIELHRRRDEPIPALTLALQLIRRKAALPQVYHAAIQLSQSIGRKEGSVRDLVHYAVQAYPELGAEFEAYLVEASPNKTE